MLPLVCAWEGNNSNSVPRYTHTHSHPFFTLETLLPTQAHMSVCVCLRGNLGGKKKKNGEWLTKEGWMKRWRDGWWEKHKQLNCRKTPTSLNLTPSSPALPASTLLFPAYKTCRQADGSSGTLLFSFFSAWKQLDSNAGHWVGGGEAKGGGCKCKQIKKKDKYKMAGVGFWSGAGRLGSGPPATPQVVDDRILTLTPLHITCPASAATQTITFLFQGIEKKAGNQSNMGLAVAEAFKIKVISFSAKHHKNK